MFSFIFMNNNNIINTIINTITMPLALTLIVMLVAAMPVIAQQLISRVAVAPAVHSVIATQTTTIVAGVRAIFGSISIAAVGRTVSDAIGGITNIIKSFIGNATVLNSQIFALPTSETYLQLIVRAPRDLVLMATRAIIVRATRAIIVRATRSLVLFATRELVLRVSTCTDLVILGSSDLLVPFGPQHLIIKEAYCEEALAHCITPVFAFVGQEILKLPISETFRSEGNMMPPWSPSILPNYSSFGMASIIGRFKFTLMACVPVFAELTCMMSWMLASFVSVMMSLVKLNMLMRTIETTKPGVQVFTDLISALSSWVCMWISALSVVSSTMTSLVKLAVEGALENYPGKVKYYWVVVILPNFCLNKVCCDYLGQEGPPPRTVPPSSGKTIIGSYKRKMAKKQYDQKIKEMRERTERSFRLEAQIPGTPINEFQTKWECAVMFRTNETLLPGQE
ncbi:unnamed protein product [Cylindrotheca closterium]|uniref:Uncharacterized protein n=1 Tax=Cylindrotheca closterium TaxID=2856 RepID=A0AAD2CHU2_9STRA|nr:unnamed protein product [Cylindrotheca closterium]